MTPQFREQFALSALTATPRVEGESEQAWGVRAAVTATSFAAAFATANHPVMAAIDAVANSKTFVATVVSVEREDSSTRGIVTLHTGEGRADEQVRTDRTDNALGLATARLAWSLIGRKVLVFVENVPYSNGARKCRTLRHLVPLDAA